MDTNTQLQQAILEALKPITGADRITIDRLPDGDLIVLLRKNGHSESTMIPRRGWEAVGSPDTQKFWVNRKIQETWDRLQQSFRQPGPGAAWGGPLRRPSE